MNKISLTQPQQNKFKAVFLCEQLLVFKMNNYDSLDYSELSTVLVKQTGNIGDRATAPFLTSQDESLNRFEGKRQTLNNNNYYSSNSSIRKPPLAESNNQQQQQLGTFAPIAPFLSTYEFKSSYGRQLAAEGVSEKKSTSQPKFPIDERRKNLKNNFHQRQSFNGYENNNGSPLR